MLDLKDLPLAQRHQFCESGLYKSFMAQRFQARFQKVRSLSSAPDGDRASIIAGLVPALLPDASPDLKEELLFAQTWFGTAPPQCRTKYLLDVPQRLEYLKVLADVTANRVR